MSLNSFTPNTKIESAKVVANFSNLSNHTRWITLQWVFSGAQRITNSLDWKQVPDAVIWERADLVIATPPTGQELIVDIERSTDNGATWTTIFTTQSNRPEIAASARQGSSTTIEVSAGVANSHLWRAVVDQVGSTVPGTTLNVFLKGKYNLD